MDFSFPPKTTTFDSSLTRPLSVQQFEPCRKNTETFMSYVPLCTALQKELRKEQLRRPLLFLHLSTRWAPAPLPQPQPPPPPVAGNPTNHFKPRGTRTSITTNGCTTLTNTSICQGSPCVRSYGQNAHI